MITIAGSGMGAYNFDNIHLDLLDFELIFCDKNYDITLPNLIKGSFSEIKEQILQNLDKNILYVVSGSPLFYSGAALIIAKAKKAKIPFKIINNTSSLEYMLAHQGISLTQVGIASLHGKQEVDLKEFLTKPYTFLVCDDATPLHLKRICAYLTQEDLTITVGERFGYEDEAFYESSIEMLLKTPPKMPYVLLLKKNYKELPPISSEEEIEHENGMITKSYKRHLALQLLELQPNELLWDVGAGSGSISIDGFKRYKVKTVLFEKNDLRSDMIEQNLTTHKVLETKLLRGDAKKLYKEENSTPQKIFVGGGGSAVLSDIAYLYERLDEDGIMVINIITLKNLTTLLTTLEEKSIPFEIKTLSVTSYKMKLLMPEAERVMHYVVVRK